MYKELAVHLGQVPAVSTELHWQDAQNFDYNDSQIAAISITFDPDVNHNSDNNNAMPELITRILNHYGTWHQVAETKASVDLEVMTSNWS
ncbi:hypothetical protein [Synechococcus sp. PCC 7502]|uniref:hypothetical protein n=1 Tax=Synechococcus sp. PCC 7502 TaxID=1173263 RepID=UPI000686B047|nr:hypothetical protein [Synechococcus sp. PCC 7502]